MAFPQDWLDANGVQGRVENALQVAGETLKKPSVRASVGAAG